MSDGLSGEISSTVTPTNHPQVALFSIAIPALAEARVEFGLDTSYGRFTSYVAAPAGGGPVSILVAGMLASSQYHMRARIQYGDGRWSTTPDQVFTTGALPSGILPTLTAAPSPGGSPSPGVELVNVIDPIGISVVSDLEGNILWYYDNAVDKSWGGYAFPIKPLRNGNFLASITNLYMPNVTTLNSVLREIDLAGDTVQGPKGPRELTLASLNAALSQMKTPQGSVVQALCYSHDVLPLWNGHAILIVQQQKLVTLTQPPGPGQFLVLGDALVDLDENFEPVWVWSTFDNLDPERHPYEFNAANDWDWTHCNAVQQAGDGDLLLSSRSQSWILKLRYQGGQGDGAILWKLGYQGSFALAGGDQTQWFFAQHYPHVLTAAGEEITSLSVFDNGNDRCNATSGGCGAGAAPPFSRGAIFKIDETALTAAVAWQYPLNQYSFWGGNVVLLPNGDIEICASEPVPIGAPPPTTDTPSQVVELGPISNPQIVWQMTVTSGAAYRSYRLPSLYPGVIWPS
jgi:arylsulfate sulfotransferase